MSPITSFASIENNQPFGIHDDSPVISALIFPLKVDIISLADEVVGKIERSTGRNALALQEVTLDYKKSLFGPVTLKFDIIDIKSAKNDDIPFPGCVSYETFTDSINLKKYSNRIVKGKYSDCRDVHSPPNDLLDRTLKHVRTNGNDNLNKFKRESETERTTKALPFKLDIIGLAYQAIQKAEDFSRKKDLVLNEVSIQHKNSLFEPMQLKFYIIDPKPVKTRKLKKGGYCIKYNTFNVLLELNKYSNLLVKDKYIYDDCTDKHEAPNNLLKRTLKSSAF